MPNKVSTNLDKVFRKLNTPQKIQDFLDRLPFNFEKKGETYLSSPAVAAASAVAGYICGPEDLEPLPTSS